jgi:hypothetical protein
MSGHRKAEDATQPHKDKIHAWVMSRNLVGAANNTKWNELLDFFREESDWTPCYRSKLVNGVISDWDVEWFCHLPFPFVGVEWFDIGVEEAIWVGMRVPRKLVDHSAPIVAKLQKIGFEFELREGVIRIWGYFPKCYEDFPPQQV